MHPPNSAENSDAALGARRSQSSLLSSRETNIRPARQQYLAKGNANELRRIAAALDATNDPKADLDTAGSAFAILEDFRRKGQFEMRQNESDFARIAGAGGFTSEQIAGAWSLYQRDGKFAAVIAMSWQALKWAEEQRAGDLAASAVLHVRASHADKNGRGFVGVPEVAEKLGTAKTTVIRADERLVKKGLMQWTKERAGQTLSIKVYQLSLPRSSSATLPLKERKAVAKQTRSSSEAVAKQTRSSSATLPLHDTRARGPLNPEPGTEETNVRLPKDELIVSSNNDNKDDKNVRPCWSRPNDVGEVFEYIYNANDNHPEEETAALKRYFNELEDDEEADRDIEYWVLMNERQGWRGVTDWHVYLRETFLKGWFPSQKRKAKRRLK